MKENIESTQHSSRTNDGDADLQPAINLARSHSAKPGVDRRRMSIAALAVVILMIFAVWHLDHRMERADQRVSEASTLAVVMVDAQQLQQITVEPVEQQISLDWNTTGRIAFDEDHLALVAPPYAGRVQELLAGKGDRVLKDQPLVKLESPDLVAVQADLAAVRSEAARVKIALDIAQSVAERERDLYSHKAAATKDLQEGEADLARAQDEVGRARAALATVESRVDFFGKQSQDIANPGAPVDRSILICAAITGYDGRSQGWARPVHKTRCRRPVFLVSDLSTLWVQAGIFESDFAFIHLGTSVEITVGA